MKNLRFLSIDKERDKVVNTMLPMSNSKRYIRSKRIAKLFKAN